MNKEKEELRHRQKAQTLTQDTQVKERDYTTWDVSVYVSGNMSDTEELRKPNSSL